MLVQLGVGYAVDIEMHGEGATAAATNADDDSRAYEWSFWTEWTS